MTKPALHDLARADLHGLLDRHPLSELSGTRLFATGCTGFFGYWLLTAIDCLWHKGVEIEVVVLSRNPDRFLAHHPEFAQATWLRFLTGDIKNFAIPCEEFDAVLHGATDTSPTAADHPLTLLEDIVDGTRHLLRLVEATHCRRLLLVSSGAIYGQQADSTTLFQEEQVGGGDPLNAANVYGEGKRIMEMLCTCSAADGLPAPIVARCFAFLGPHLPAHLAPAQLVRDAIEGRPIALRGDGSPQRSYLYAADLAVWLLTLLARGRPGRAYNVGGHQSLSLKDLAYLIRDTLAPHSLVHIQGVETGAPRHRYLPDTQRARGELGLDAWTSPRDCILRMGDVLRMEAN